MWYNNQSCPHIISATSLLCYNAPLNTYLTHLLHNRTLFYLFVHLSSLVCERFLHIKVTPLSLHRINKYNLKRILKLIDYAVHWAMQSVHWYNIILYLSNISKICRAYQFIVQSFLRLCKFWNSALQCSSNLFHLILLIWYLHLKTESYNTASQPVRLSHSHTTVVTRKSHVTILPPLGNFPPLVWELSPVQQYTSAG